MGIKILTSITSALDSCRSSFVIVTHKGIFHSDDVVAVAILCLLHRNENIVVIRCSRDDNDTQSMCSICVDVGEGAFDHHQAGFNAKRDSGITYASAGLVWKEFGSQVVSEIIQERGLTEKLSGSCSRIVQLIDEYIMKFVDAEDNGIKCASIDQIWKKRGHQIISQAIEEHGLTEKLSESSPLIAELIDKIIMKLLDATNSGIKPDSHYMSFITAFLPVWYETDPNFEDAFMEALDVTIKVLEKKINQAIAEVLASNTIEERIAQAKYHFGGILEIPSQTIPWLEILCKFNKDQVQNGGPCINFVIFRYPAGGWAVQCVPPSLEQNFEQRIPFPKEWAGLKGADLVSISGVEGATRCHNFRFFAQATSREAVVKMCELAMKQS